SEPSPRHNPRTISRQHGVPGAVPHLSPEAMPFITSFKLIAEMPAISNRKPRKIKSDFSLVGVGRGTATEPHKGISDVRKRNFSGSTQLSVIGLRIELVCFPGGG